LAEFRRMANTLSPTRVGMDRASTPLSTTPSTKPHACGDGPFEMPPEESVLS